MSWQGIHVWKKIRLLAIGFVLTAVIFETGLLFYSVHVLLFEKPREWIREAAPFRALGARVIASGGGDMGYMADREGIARIHFDENVGDEELAVLAKRIWEPQCTRAGALLRSLRPPP